MTEVITGQCETCGAEMNNTPECDACGGHLDGIPSLYRGHKLCGHCVHAWEILERVLDREATWGDFLSPQLKIFPNNKENSRV